MKETELLTLPGKATAVSLELPPRLSQDEWTTILFRTIQLNYFSRWAIGAALNYGMRHFGEVFFWQVVSESETGLTPETIKLYMYVEERVDPLIRIKNWSACRQVAKLKPKEQAEWLERFERERWTVRELVDQLVTAGLRNTRLVQREADRLAERSDEMPPDDETPPPAYGVPEVKCYYCGKRPTRIAAICEDCGGKLK